MHPPIPIPPTPSRAANLCGFIHEVRRFHGTWFATCRQAHVAAQVALKAKI
jgi:hypothetical protein